MKITQGNRVYYPAAQPHEVEPKLQPGDYWEYETHGIWLVCAPNGDIGSVNTKIWGITEHEDKTITVKPSIQFHAKPAPGFTAGWHGFLEHGMWREC